MARSRFHGALSIKRFATHREVELSIRTLPPVTYGWGKIQLQPHLRIMARLGTSFRVLLKKLSRSLRAH
jgi:hypothetical protein